MELEQVKSAVDAFLVENINERTAVILMSDKNRAITYGTGKRGNLVQLFYQLLMQDTKEEMISCLDEAFQMYMNAKKQEDNNRMIQMPVMVSKIKS